MPGQCKLKPTPEAIIAGLESALDEAERKAHLNLARYKFNNFAYWAAIWVHLNHVGYFHRPNPFFAYVELAGKKGGELDAKAEPN